MSSEPETGHAKNASNFLHFNNFLRTLGAEYNPMPPAISLTALTNMQSGAVAQIQTVKAAKDVWKSATNFREVAFDELNPFTTRLLGALKTFNVLPQTIDDLTALVNKIRGVKKRSRKAPFAAAVDPSAPEPVTRSSSQQSFDQRSETFSQIVLLLQGVAGYSPNEVEFQIASLQARLDTLILLNTKAAEAIANLRKARADRNIFFYAPETGVLDRIKQAKAYILSRFGKSSQQNNISITHKFVRVIPKNEAK